jgi:hypothetical protein
LDPNQLDVWRLLGDVMVKQRRWREAALAFDRSLKLALAGHRSLSAFITNSPESSLADPDHAATFVRSARALERLGEHRTAIANHRIGVAAGIDGCMPHMRLARLYAREGAWRASLDEARAAATRLPGIVADIRRRVRGTFSRKRKVLQPFSLG